MMKSKANSEWASEPQLRWSARLGVFLIWCAVLIAIACWAWTWQFDDIANKDKTAMVVIGSMVLMTLSFLIFGDKLGLQRKSTANEGDSDK